jgi:hypothetical protein
MHCYVCYWYAFVAISKISSEIKFLILDTCFPATLYLCKQISEDPWLFFEAKRGPRAKKVWEAVVYSICVLDLQTIVRCVNVGVLWSRLRNCTETEHCVGAQASDWCPQAYVCWCDIKVNCMTPSLPVLLAWVVDIEEFALFTVAISHTAAHRRYEIYTNSHAHATHGKINFYRETQGYMEGPRLIWSSQIAVIENSRFLTANKVWKWFQKLIAYLISWYQYYWYDV